jgi:hypothetical protein
MPYPAPIRLLTPIEYPAYPIWDMLDMGGGWIWILVVLFRSLMHFVVGWLSITNE